MRLLCRIVLGVIISILTACVTAPQQPVEKIYWPKPPDTPRYVYETSLRSPKSIQEWNMSLALHAAVTGLRRDDAFAKPYDVAAQGGHIVVTDSVSRVAVMFDVPRRKMYTFGARDEGQLIKPLGVAMDGKQWVYIADVSARRVNVYDALGKFLLALGADGGLQRPVDVAVNQGGDRIYVVDTGGIDSTAHRVVVYNNKGEQIQIIGSRGLEPGQFNLPVQAAVAKDGTLYVLDSGNFRIQVFNSQGELVKVWGKAGRNFGDLARPRGLAVDNEGNVYVTDGAFRNFQIFNSDGKLLMAIGGSELHDLPGQYVMPAGIAVDETDRIYIVDQVLKKVEVIRKLSVDEIRQLSPTSVNLDGLDSSTMIEQPSGVGVDVPVGETLVAPESPETVVDEIAPK